MYPPLATHNPCQNDKDPQNHPSPSDAYTLGDYGKEKGSLKKLLVPRNEPWKVKEPSQKKQHAPPRRQPREHTKNAAPKNVLAQCYTSNSFTIFIVCVFLCPSEMRASGAKPRRSQTERQGFLDIFEFQTTGSRDSIVWRTIGVCLCLSSRR